MDEHDENQPIRKVLREEGRTWFFMLIFIIIYLIVRN